MLMQNKKLTIQVNLLCRFSILTVLLLLHSSVWAEKVSDTAEKQIIQLEQKGPSSVTTKGQQNPQASATKTPPSTNKENKSKVCQTRPGRAPEMLIIPAGTFMMGSLEQDKNAYDTEKLQHQVTIKRPFAIGRCEVTFADYALFAHADKLEMPGDEGWGQHDRPVINVRWEDAQAYVRWLSQATGRRYRLPTEAEWEYAARAGTATNYYWDDQQNINDFAWYRENSDDKTHPVGEKKANKFGLYDMSGNVWEWVQDCWHDHYEAAPVDGSAWEEANEGDCGRRVLRGGSWSNIPGNLRSANRFSRPPDSRYDLIGFRLAQDLN